MHKTAYDIADYISFAVVAAGFILVFASGAGTRYKSVDAMPKWVLVRTALIWFPLVILFVFVQVNRHTTPWLMYVPVPWLYPLDPI